jgi:hypothetical protein
MDGKIFLLRNIPRKSRKEKIRYIVMCTHLSNCIASKNHHLGKSFPGSRLSQRITPAHKVAGRKGKNRFVGL